MTFDAALVGRQIYLLMVSLVAFPLMRCGECNFSDSVVILL